MDAPAVAEYLKHNPKFFEDYADFIAEIFVASPPTVKLARRHSRFTFAAISAAYAK